LEKESEEKEKQGERQKGERKDVIELKSGASHNTMEKHEQTALSRQIRTEEGG
jgi:hypothetical protein